MYPSQYLFMLNKILSESESESENGHSQPWLSRDLGRDWAVT